MTVNIPSENHIIHQLLLLQKKKKIAHVTPNLEDLLKYGGRELSIIMKSYTEHLFVVCLTLDQMQYKVGVGSVIFNRNPSHL